MKGKTDAQVDLMIEQMGQAVQRRRVQEQQTEMSQEPLGKQPFKTAGSAPPQLPPRPKRE